MRVLVHLVPPLSARFEPNRGCCFIKIHVGMHQIVFIIFSNFGKPQGVYFSAKENRCGNANEHWRNGVGVKDTQQVTMHMIFILAIDGAPL